MSTDRDRSPIDRSRRRQEKQRSNDCRVFVSNFPYDVKWQELKDLFRDHVGNVEYVELFNDESGKPRGCGIMEFASPEVTKEVVKKMDKLEWKGRKLSVKEAADAERDKYGRIVKSDKGRTTSHRDSSTSGKGSNRVYVSNLPYEMKWQDVKDLFRDHVGEVAYVELFNDERGKPRGCGILEFDSEELAQKAIRKLNKHELRGRKMMVQEALDSERDKYGYIIKDGSGSRGGRSDRGDRGGDRDRDRRGGDRDRGDRDRDRHNSSSNAGPRNFGYTYGLSVEFLESLGIEGPLQCKVFVANLCFTVDEQKLRDVFRLAGRIVSVEVSKDRDGKSRGYGLVEYTHPVEAVQAISMFNNQKLYDRPMGVRFDRDPSPEETRLPNRLPEGLAGVGMGLGAGGKPLTDVLKNLQQNNDNLGADNKSDNNVLNSSSVKTLADLTPALALIAQLAGNQAGALGNVNQGNVPMVGAGFGNINPGNMNPGNMNTMSGNFGFNNSAPVVPQQQQPQQNLNSGYGNMSSGGYNMGQQQQSYGGMTGSNMGPPSNLGPSNMGPSSMGPSSMGPSSMGPSSMGPSSVGSSNINRQGNMSSNMSPGLIGSSNNQGYSTLGPSGPGDRRQSNLGRPSGGPQGSSHMAPIDRSDRRPDQSAPYNPVPAPYPGDARAVDVPAARPAFDTVMVRNLPLDLDWQDLREFFSTCGDVKNAMIQERGVGLIRFATERSAERALNYDGTSKWGRVLDVRIY